MEDKIQINGVWYQKMNTDTEPVETLPVFNEDEVTHFEGCVYETLDYSWEARRIQKVDGPGFYTDISITFIDKAKPDWATAVWDNNEWYLNVWKNKEEASITAHQLMTVRGVYSFRQFIGYLINLGYIKGR